MLGLIIDIKPLREIGHNGLRALSLVDRQDLRILPVVEFDSELADCWLLLLKLGWWVIRLLPLRLVLPLLLAKSTLWRTLSARIPWLLLLLYRHVLYWWLIHNGLWLIVSLLLHLRLHWRHILHALLLLHHGPHHLWGGESSGLIALRDQGLLHNWLRIILLGIAQYF